MNALGYFVLVLVIACPIAWLVSEFKGSRNVRVGLGILSLLLSFAVAWLVGSLNRLSYNAWYGSASKELVDAVLLEVEAGRTTNAVVALKKLQGEFGPTYENRAHYDTLVKAAVAEMQSKSSK